MDTPEKHKIGTPASKFEDSPVFNYINSLSPIKPVKSLHITQTFNSLSFASLPSVFTSPHVTSHKESRFITATTTTTTRYNGSDSAKPENSSENPPETQREIASASLAIGDGKTAGAIELPRALNYDSGGPECTEPALEASEEEKGSETTRYHEMCLGEPRRDAAEDCDWEDLISDSADILIFDSPCEGGAAEGFDPVTRLCEEQRKGKEAETQVDFACKSVLSLHRGIRRRCLDFETAGTRRKSSDESSSGEERLGPIRHCDSSSRVRVLPGIGLHLNALAASASKDCQIVSSETLPSGIQIRSVLCPAAPSLDSNSTEDRSRAPVSLHVEELYPNSPKKKRRRVENGGESEGCKRCNCKKSKCLKLYCECFAAGVYCIEPCACQECFNTPIHEDTVLATRKQIESRNPLAFAPKVIRSSDSAPEYGHDESSKTPASARHKRGCNCKKSGCLKKYCECFQGGVGCSVNCRCEGCKNAFGRKDGSAVVIDVEAELEEEEAESSKKCTANKTSQKIESIHSEDRLPSGSVLPLTPLQINSRPLIPLPFSSKGKPPRSSLLSAGSSSSLGSYGQHKFAKPSIFRSQPAFEKCDPMLPENGELPEILRGDTSPVAGIKTLSPNSKRISPPECRFGSPSGRRSGRKLILQSIPSFPSLTPHQ